MHHVGIAEDEPAAMDVVDRTHRPGRPGRPVDEQSYRTRVGRAGHVLDPPLDSVLVRRGEHRE